MIRWIPYTFIRTVLFFIGGILLGFAAPNAITQAALIVLILLLVVLYFLVVLGPRGMRRHVNPGWIALPLIFMLGYIHLVGKTGSRDADHLINIKEPISHYETVVTGYAEQKQRSWKLEASVTKVHTEEWQHAGGKIILYLA